jgi:HEAT repeat protein
MKRALWLLAAAIPAALTIVAQPKTLVNAKVDTRSAAAGLEPAFKALVSAQPQPAWIGYAVPSTRTFNLGCDYGNNSGWGPAGVVHLEPPDHALILFRVVNNAVERIRSLSPDCEIDAGDVPFHWLTDVQPVESVALLASFATRHDMPYNSAMNAIATHADPAADQALERLLAVDQPQPLRLRVVAWMGSARGKHGLEVLKNLIANDPDLRVRERAVNAVSSSREPEAIDLLIAIARSDKNAKLRAQAVSDLGHKQAEKVAGTLTNAIENDSDLDVRRRAVSALQSLPDGEGIPLLINVVKNTRSPEVRKQAMSSLRSSRDPRALAFFEDVLK